MNIDTSFNSNKFIKQGDAISVVKIAQMHHDVQQFQGNKCLLEIVKFHPKTQEV